MKIGKLLLLTTMLGAVLLSGCGNKTADDKTIASVGTGAPAAAEPAASSDKINVKIATVLAESSPGHKALLKFTEEVEKRVPGKVNFMLYPNSQMGGERDFGNGMMLGTIQGAIIADVSMGLIAEIPEARLGEVPFLFKDWKAYYAMMDGWYKDILDEAYIKNGFYNMADFFITNSDIATAAKPVRTPEDLKGMKIRCWENDGPFKMLEALGAVPVTMPFGDVYTAIQQKTVDGVITGTFQLVPQRFAEVAPYVSAIQTLSCYQGLVFSKSWLDSQPEDIRQAFFEAAQVAHDYCRDEIAATAEEEAYRQMEEMGCTISYLTEEERQAFVEAGKGTWPYFRERLGADLFDRVVAFQEEYEKNRSVGGGK